MPASGELIVEKLPARSLIGRRRIEVQLEYSAALFATDAKLEELLPWLYLIRGLSTSGFSSALTALLGKEEAHKSPPEIFQTQH